MLSDTQIFIALVLGVFPALGALRLGKALSS
jgi:photosystem I reaction center subunit XII